MARRAKAEKKERKPRGGARATRSKKPVTAEVEVEVVEEAGGMSIDAGIAIMTLLLLIAAILYLDAHLARYEHGMFF